jgi:hypothetical protein
MLRTVAWFALEFSDVHCLFLRAVVRSESLRLIICVSQIPPGRQSVFVWVVYSCLSRPECRVRLLQMLRKLIYLFNRYLLSVNHVLGALLDPGNSVVNNNKEVGPVAAYSLVILSTGQRTTTFLFTITYQHGQDAGHVVQCCHLTRSALHCGWHRCSFGPAHWLQGMKTIADHHKPMAIDGRCWVG